MTSGLTPFGLCAPRSKDEQYALDLAAAEMRRLARMVKSEIEIWQATYAPFGATSPTCVAAVRTYLGAQIGLLASVDGVGRLEDTESPTPAHEVP